MLDDVLVFGAFQQLQTKRASIEGAAEHIEHVAKCLVQDELNESLAPRLRSLAADAQRLLNPPLPQGHILLQLSWQMEGKEAVLAELEGLVSKARAMLAPEGSAGVVLTGNLVIAAPAKKVR